MDSECCDSTGRDLSFPDNSAVKGACEGSMNGGKPLISFGVITDVQYADIDDGRGYDGTPRFYRHSLKVLRRAIDSWHADDDVAFVVHLGDIIDGQARGRSVEAITAVISEFDRFNRGLTYHMLGNHCLYNFPREELRERLRIPTASPDVAHYHFTPCRGFRVVVLDNYDVSVLGRSAGDARHDEAVRILKERNPNLDDKNNPEGLLGVERRFVQFNGGIGEEQLKWLDDTLGEAERMGEKVIVMGHLPMNADAVAPALACLCWNYKEVMAVIHKRTCVVAHFSGHAHRGGYAVDNTGVHHRVLEAALECKPNADCFGKVEVYADGIRLRGIGEMKSTDMPFSLLHYKTLNPKP